MNKYASIRATNAQHGRHPDCVSDPPSLFDTDAGCSRLADAVERLGYPDHFAGEIVEAARNGWSDHACADLTRYLKRHVQPAIDREDSE